MGFKNTIIGLITLTSVISLVVVFGWSSAGITGSATKLSFALDSLSIIVLGLIILTLGVLTLDLILFKRRL